MNPEDKSMLRMLNDVSEYNNNFQKERVKEITNAMKLIDRKIFVPANLQSAAYDDAPLPIGEGQTISQPSTVAKMLMLAEVSKGMTVLEVGAGSGWNAALIAYIAYPGKVFASERIDDLTRNAKKNIEKLKKTLSPREKNKLRKLTLETEDALDRKSKLWKRKYDRIIVTAGIEKKDIKTKNIIEEMAAKLLKAKGILVCPYTLGPLQIYRKDKILKKTETFEDYIFVPLIGGKA